MSIMIIILLILLSKIRINISKCKISNVNENGAREKLKKDILIYVEFYFLGIIKIAKIKITKNMIKKLKIEKEIKDIEKDVKVIKKAHLVEIIKKLKFKVKKACFILDIGVDDVIITSYMVALISTILRLFI